MATKRFFGLAALILAIGVSMALITYADRVSAHHETTEAPAPVPIPDGPGDVPETGTETTVRAPAPACETIVDPTLWIRHKPLLEAYQGPRRPLLGPCQGAWNLQQSWLRQLTLVTRI